MTSNFLIFVPMRIYVTHFALTGVLLDASARFLLSSILLLLSSVPSPLMFLPSFLCPLHQLSVLLSFLFPLLPSLDPVPILNPAKRSGERCKLPQRFRAKPSRQTLLVHFAFFLRNFCHWYNDKYERAYILLFKKWHNEIPVGAT